MRRRAWLLTAAVALISQNPLLRGQRVEARAGDVYYADKLGQLHRMTGNGMNSDPALSLDGKSIIFVRETLIPADFDEPEHLHPFRTQIWLLSVTGASEPKLVFAGPVVVNGSEYVEYYEPKSAPDNQHVYFLIRYDAAEFGLVRLDVANGH